MAQAACDESAEPALATTPAVASASASGVRARVATPPKTTDSKSDASATPCGVAPLPDCPLRGWMTTQAASAMQEGSATRISEVFTRMAAIAPPGYPNWASIAIDGSRSAKAGELEGARAACRSCHLQYRERYKSELAARELP